MRALIETVISSNWSGVVGALAGVTALFYYRRQARAGERQAVTAESGSDESRARRTPIVAVVCVPVGQRWWDVYQPHVPCRVPVTLRHLGGDVARDVVVRVGEFSAHDGAGVRLFRRSGSLRAGVIAAGMDTTLHFPLRPCAGETAGDVQSLRLMGRVLIDVSSAEHFVFETNPWIVSPPI